MHPAQLRVVVADPQAVFPWVDPGNTRALGLPVADLVLWQGRADIKRPGYMAVRFAMTGDPRYRPFLDGCCSRGLAAEYGLACLWMTAGYLLTLEAPGLLAHDGRVLTTAHVRDFWRIGRESAEWFDRAVAEGLRAGWLTLVDISDQSVRNAYACVRARTRACGEDGRTEEAKSKSSTRAVDPEPVEYVEASAETPTTMVLTRLVQELRDQRRRMGKPEYPSRKPGSGAQDVQDLRLAIVQATAASRLHELVALLRDTAHWADDGRGYRMAMMDAGFLQRHAPRGEKGGRPWR